MREFIDKTATANGTPINRDYLMAIQGFDSVTIDFKDDGSIEETNKLGQKKTTTFLDDGSVQETFMGDFTLTKKTIFGDNQISEVIS